MTGEALAETARDQSDDSKPWEDDSARTLPSAKEVPDAIDHLRRAVASLDDDGTALCSLMSYERWNQRFSISVRKATNESQKTPDDYAEGAHAFRSSVNELRLHRGYTPFNMANMDQTMVRMDCLASRTNDIIGESSVRITNTGCARRGFSFTDCLCIGPQTPGLRHFEGAERQGSNQGFYEASYATNVHATVPKNGWMSSDKFQEWLSRVWGPNTDDVRWLLGLEQAPIHKTQAARNALEERETDVIYVPAGCTSILQPADVYWNRPFKANLRRSWEERRAEKNPKGNL
ncbi:hypothetical protein HPB50_011315 [Hyalomma asiaticum]|uniref:Uncharacterized protein n=1 Tax=Hyalomma asiaticum TaxID=266040 RepID=A0ACB7SMC7_HYAAI|nr:hypothetical protein HPB50_011315 [Hyalomma asiaticum]